jgi:hypothetical protein
MKKFLFLSILTISTIALNAQVFNTSSTLKRGQFSAGFEPGFYINGAADFNLFLHGGAGITKGVDLGLKVGVLTGGSTYVGGDVEFALGKRFSLSAGAHSFGDFGLDGTALFTFPIRHVAHFYTGFDADIDFGNNDVYFPLWIPVGLEIPMGNRMAFLFESEICLTNVGSHYLGGGLNFFF